MIFTPKSSWKYISIDFLFHSKDYVTFHESWLKRKIILYLFSSKYKSSTHDLIIASTPNRYYWFLCYLDPRTMQRLCFKMNNAILRAKSVSALYIITHINTIPPLRSVRSGRSDCPRAWEQLRVKCAHLQCRNCPLHFQFARNGINCGFTYWVLNIFI